MCTHTTSFVTSKIAVAVASCLIATTCLAKDFHFEPTESGSNVVYFKLDSNKLSNGDNITLTAVQGRIQWDSSNPAEPNTSLDSDLSLGTVKVTHKNDGWHSGALIFRGYKDSKYKVTVDKVVLGYNTALQVFDDMREDQLTIRKVVVNNDVPTGMDVADFEQHKEQFATQIEVWQQKNIGKVGATMNIGELTVEDGRIVALSNRPANATEAYIK